MDYIVRPLSFCANRRIGQIYLAGSNTLAYLVGASVTMTHLLDLLLVISFQGDDTLSQTLKPMLKGNRKC